MVRIKVGSSCNNNCKFCKYLDIKSENDKSLHDLKNELASLEKEKYAEVVFPCNSDIRRDFLEILKYAKSLGFKITLQTNGRIFYYKEFVKATVGSINKFEVYLHGVRSVHNEMCKTESFDQTIRGIKNLLEFEADIQVNTVVTGLNYKSILETADIINGLGIKNLKLTITQDCSERINKIIPLVKEKGLNVEVVKNRLPNMNSKHKNQVLKLAYFIGGLKNYHLIPHASPLLKSLPGTVYTQSKEIVKAFKEKHPRLKFRYFDTQDFFIVIEEWEKEHFDGIIFFDYINRISLIKFIKSKLSPDTKLVQIFHGTSDKNYILNEEQKLYDLILVPGKKDFDRLNDKERVKMVGLAMLDPYLNNKIKTAEIKKKLGIDISQKIVLYAPTWDNIFLDNPQYYSSFNYLMPELINKEIQDFVLIIKPHPNIFKYNHGMTQYMRLKLTRKKNIILLDEDQFVDVTDLMAVSDVLVTDISAVSSMFLAFNKPIIFYDHPGIKDCDEEKGVWRCGDAVDNVNDLFKYIELNIKNPKRHEEKRKKCAEEYFYKLDGKATERAVNEICKILK